MSTVIAIPIRRASAKAWLEKGRGWSALDELVLWALSREPKSAGKLASELDIPRRVVLEMIVRMMRFRLVEAVLLGGLPAFQATEYGVAVVASGAEIPTSKRRMSRNVSFVYDRITGTVFPRRDVKSETVAGIRFLREKGVDVRDLEVRGAVPKTTPKENFIRFQKVLREDETLLFFDGDTFLERQDEFMMVAVDGNDLRGLPESAPTALADEIRRVAVSMETARPIVVESMIAEDDERALPIGVPIQFGNRDLIFGDEDHREKFKEIVSNAKRRIFLHSTFLRKDGFTAWMREFKAAVRKGARIDIFWGSGTAEKPGESTFLEASALAKEIAKDEDLRDRVRIHLRSTGSHAKLLVADDGNEGYIAVVGSCNWLFSSFDRFELSVAFRDSKMVAEVVDAFGSLVARPGFRPEIGTELHILERNLRTRNSPAGNHLARMIVGQAHEAILREASDGAPERFLVASDKFGNSAFPNAIIPAEVAAATTRTTPVVVYGSTTGKVSGKMAAELTFDVRERGVRLLRISEGFHAKFLLWGDDDIVVTSINWCSWASPPDWPFGEIGVHVHRAGIARDLALRLQFVWPQL